METLPTLTIEKVSSYEATLVCSMAGIAEYRMSRNLTELSVENANLVQIPSSGKFTIHGLKPSCCYVIDIRVLLESPSTFSNRSVPIVIQTNDYSATSNAEKLRIIRKRMEVLREMLANPDTLSIVSVDGISESWTSRESASKELKDLEYEEARLMNGGSRIRGIDLRRL